MSNHLGCWWFWPIPTWIASCVSCPWRWSRTVQPFLYIAKQHGPALFRTSNPQPFLQPSRWKCTQGWPPEYSRFLQPGKCVSKNFIICRWSYITSWNVSCRRGVCRAWCSGYCLMVKKNHGPLVVTTVTLLLAESLAMEPWESQIPRHDMPWHSV